MSAIHNIDALKAEDQASVSDWYANPVAYERKRKADRLAQAVAEATGNATADAAPPSTPPTKKSRATPSASKLTPEKAAAVQGEAARRQVYQEVFGGLPVEQLKGCLRANQQLLSGNKADLVERCVDRKLYGNLPRCPQCGIGRLKVSYASLLGHGGQGAFTCPAMSKTGWHILRPAGSPEAPLSAKSSAAGASASLGQSAACSALGRPYIYISGVLFGAFRHRCPGGYDDDEYVRCSYRAQSAVRLPWSETGHEAHTKPPRKSSGGKSTAGGASAAGGEPAGGGTSASGAAGSAAAPAVDAKPCIVVD